MSSPERRGKRQQSPQRRLRRQLIRLLAVSVAVTLVVAGTLEVAHLVTISAHEPRLLPICRIMTSQPVVALTFDDGPDTTFTPAILDLLEQNDARATFFLIGSRLEENADLVSRELDAGMELGNHTWSHTSLPSVSTPDALSDVERTQAALVQRGVSTRLVRAPLGEATADQLAALADARLRAIHWSVSVDHQVNGHGLSSEAAAAAMREEIRPGDIILAHDHALPSAGPVRVHALRAMSSLVRALTAEGIRLTTVGDLLSLGPAVHAQPRRWFWQSGFSCPSSNPTVTANDETGARRRS